MRLTPLVLLLACSPIATSQSAGPLARETLVYNVEWRLITAGKAQVDWKAGPRAGWDLKLHLESVGLVSKLFKVQDDYAAAMNQGLCASSVQISTREGNRERESRAAFDAASGKALYQERDLLRNALLLNKETEIPPCVHDVIGGLFYLRTLNLEPGQSTQIAVSDGKKSVMARVEAQQREDVRTPEGLFKTVCYEIYLFNGVLYHRSAHLNVWLSDDHRKLPVQVRVRMPFTVGTITLQLAKQE